MTHLGERITDFVFGEMSAAEMAEAKQHVAGCPDCLKQVQQLEHTRQLLKAAPDVEPPRQIVFEVERKPAAGWSWSWSWLMPVGAAAAFALVVLLVVPIQLQWNASQVTIAFGKAPAPVAVPAPAPAIVPQPVATPVVDYGRIAKDLQTSQQAWLEQEVARRMAGQTTEIQRLKGQMTYLAVNQQAVERANIENSSSIQVLAERMGAQE